MLRRSSGRDPSREAFGVVFDRHATSLYRYLLRRVGAGDADALNGEVFRIAFERRADYDPHRPDARPWLYGIATNLVADHRASRGPSRTRHAPPRGPTVRQTTTWRSESSDAIEARELLRIG